MKNRFELFQVFPSPFLTHFDFVTYNVNSQNAALYQRAFGVRDDNM